MLAWVSLLSWQYRGTPSWLLIPVTFTLARMLNITNNRQNNRRVSESIVPCWERVSVWTLEPSDLVCGCLTACWLPESPVQAGFPSLRSQVRERWQPTAGSQGPGSADTKTYRAQDTERGNRGNLWAVSSEHRECVKTWNQSTAVFYQEKPVRSRIRWRNGDKSKWKWDSEELWFSVFWWHST